MIAVLFTEPQNVWVWEAPLEGIWSNPWCKQGQVERITHDHLLLNISNKGVLTSLGNLCHCSVTLTMRKFCLMFRVNFLSLIFFSLPPVPSLGSTEKNLAISLCCTLPSHVYTCGWDPSESCLLQDKQSQLSWLFLVGEMLLSSLWHFAGLLPVCSCVSCIGEPRTDPSTPDVILQGLN